MMMKFRFNKQLRILGISLITVLTLVVFASAIVSMFYEKAVIRYMKKYFDEHLLTQVVMDDIKFSLFKGFPHATFEISNLEVLSGIEFSPEDFDGLFADTLIKAKKVFFQFDLIKLFRKNYELKKIEISDGTINVLFDHNNRHNLIIWKKKTDAEKQGYSIKLRQILFSSMQLNLISIPEHIKLNSFSEKTNFRGTYAGSILSGDTRGNFTIDSLIFREKMLIKEAALKLQIKMLFSNNHFRIRQSNLQLNKAEAKITGEYKGGEKSYIDLNIELPKFGIEEIVSLLPIQDKYHLNNYSFTGKGRLKAVIKGSLNKSEHVSINSDFKLNDGLARNNKNRAELKHINLTGSVSGTKADNFIIRIDQITSSLGKGKISGNLLINDLNAPRFKTSINSTIDLNELRNFLNMDSVENMKGFAHADFSAEGNLNRLSGDSLVNWLSLLKNGKFVFDDVGFKIKKQNSHFQHITGEVNVDNTIHFDSLALQINGNDFLINGFLENPSGYLLNKGTLISDLKVTANKINLNTILTTIKKSNSLQKDKVNSILPEGIHLKAIINTKEFSAGKFKATDLKFSMELIEDSIYIDNFQMKFPDGSISGNALLTEYNRHQLSVTCNSQVQTINIQQLFSSFNNFTQHFILDKNVKGSVTGKVSFFLQWDSDLKFIQNSMKANANIEITNGELVQFEPMMALSKYIDVEELRHIRFKTLRNEIFINDRMVRIPEMAIQSTAFNITASGEHSFDNHFDYRVRVLLSEVLFNKARKRKQEMNEFLVEETNADRTTIPLIIAGTPKQFDVSFDRKRAFNLTRKNSRDDSSISHGRNNPDNFRIEWEEKAKAKNTPVNTSPNLKQTDYKIEWDEDDSTESDTIN
jgi:hypothetical protein